MKEIKTVANSEERSALVAEMLELKLTTKPTEKTKARIQEIQQLLDRI